MKTDNCTSGNVNIYVNIYDHKHYQTDSNYIKMQGIPINFRYKYIKLSQGGITLAQKKTASTTDLVGFRWVFMPV